MLKHETPPLKRELLAGLDVDSLVELVLALDGQLKGLQSEVERLKAQLAKDSQNSGKPPSSDGVKKRPMSLRERGKRTSGGQKGHEGQTLEAVAEPDKVIRHEIEVCPHCEADLRDTSIVSTEKRQVFDVPPVRLEVTEHQAVVKCCPGCGQAVKGVFPDGVTQAVQYGTRLQSLLVYLNSYHLLPLARTSEIVGEVYGLRPSQGAIIAATQRLAGQVGVSVAAIRQQLIDSDLLHADETGARVGGHLRWLHVASTQRLTLYGIHDKRSQVAMRAQGVLPDFRGCVVHDAFVSYWQFEQCRHALCNAHQLRELRFVSDVCQQAWASDMADLLLTMKRLRASPEPISPQQLQDYEHRYDALVVQGLTANPPLPPTGKPGRPKRSPAQNLLERFLRYKDAILAFWRDPDIPFDNNLAERDVRMMKLQQKISGCFRTLPSATTFCLIRSYLSTVRKHHLNLLDAISLALAGSPFIPSTT